MPSTISLNSADRPQINERQRELAKELIGMGLSRLAIISLAMGKSKADLDHADIGYGQGLINKLCKELGYNVTDARNVRTPYMEAAVRQATRTHRIRVRVA